MITLPFLVLINGCVASIGGGDKHQVHNPTVGQQLVDLKTAHDSGAINDDEYRA